MSLVGKARYFFSILMILIILIETTLNGWLLALGRPKAGIMGKLDYNQPPAPI